jgi:hypothetical protein
VGIEEGFSLFWIFKCEFGVNKFAAFLGLKLSQNLRIFLDQNATEFLRKICKKREINRSILNGKPKRNIKNTKKKL